jgi:hypothetical protein
MQVDGSTAALPKPQEGSRGRKRGESGEPFGGSVGARREQAEGVGGRYTLKEMPVDPPRPFLLMNGRVLEGQGRTEH